MTSHDRQEEGALAALVSLRTHDVSRDRADRVRRRCHVVLQARARQTAPAGETSGRPFVRIVVPVLGGAWCLAYLLEIVRLAATVYR